MTEKTYGGFTIAKLKEMCAINTDPYDLISLAVPDLIAEIERLNTQTLYDSDGQLKNPEILDNIFLTDNTTDYALFAPGEFIEKLGLTCDNPTCTCKLVTPDTKSISQEDQQWLDEGMSFKSDDIFKDE